MSQAVERSDERWRAVAQRDPRQDGAFVFAVRTTGVYCRPSCGARRAKRENVTFFDLPAAAERAGFRACLRCRPADDAWRRRRGELVASLCRRLERDEPAPKLAELARRARMSPERVRRTFQAVLGVTPREYLVTSRVQRAAAAMQRGASVTAAMHTAGYASSSGFHRDATARMGMLPKQVRNGGDGVQMMFTVRGCSLGKALVAATARGVCAVLLGDDERALVDDLAARFPNAARERGDAAFEQLVAAAIAVVDGGAAGAGLPIDVRGTAFQQRVWQQLQQIPAGATIDYAQLAACLGKPKAARAVAAACAANPLAVVVPCHRVVRKDGSLAGYRWGVGRKRALLDRERGRR